jgi:hypothetical protein
MLAFGRIVLLKQLLTPSGDLVHKCEASQALTRGLARQELALQQRPALAIGLRVRVDETSCSS